MTIFYKTPGAAITADMSIYSSDGLTTAELQDLESMDAADLIEYAETVPSWDYVDPAMWDYIAYSLDMDNPTTPDEWEDWDPEKFLTEAKEKITAKAA